MEADLRARIAELEAELERRRNRSEFDAVFEQAYAHLAEMASDGVMLVVRSQLAFANEPLAEMLDVDRSKLLGRELGACVAPDQREIVCDRYARRIRGEEVIPRYPSALQDRKGEPVQTEIRARAVPFQGEVADLILVRDLRRERRLDRLRRDLHRKDETIHELLCQYEQQRQRMARRLQRSLEQAVLPSLEACRDHVPGEQRERLVEAEEQIRRAGVPFEAELIDRARELTPVELRICARIRRGLSSKEIAAREHVALSTVQAHRKNIRRKLGLTNRGANLAAHLHRTGLDA